MTFNQALHPEREKKHSSISSAFSHQNASMQVENSIRFMFSIYDHSKKSRAFLPRSRRAREWFEKVSFVTTAQSIFGVLNILADTWVLWRFPRTQCWQDSFNNCDNVIGFWCTHAVFSQSLTRNLSFSGWGDVFAWVFEWSDLLRWETSFAYHSECPVT